MIRSEAASLTAVTLRRGKRSAGPSHKPGDITAQLTAEPVEAPIPPLERAPPPHATPAADAMSLPPPASLPTVAPPPLEILLGLEREPPRRQAGYWDFVDYWDRLRSGARLPLLATLDRELVASAWPDSLIVSYSGDRAMPQVARLSRPTGNIEYTPMVTDWIIACAREVARQGEAMEDVQEFPLTTGNAGYRLLLLPFAGRDEKESDHVLCHLSRSQADRTNRYR